MNFYNQLLESYDLLKKRKFRISEGKNSIEAESKAKHYIQLALSHAGSEHYIVTIPELGANAKIYVAKAGKQVGNVVVDNVLSMYPLAVSDSAGNPKRPAYFQFVGKFDNIAAKESMPNQEMPEVDPMSGMIALPKFTESLMKANTKLVELATSKKLFSMPVSMASPTWMSPGPMKDFQELQRKIIGPDPFSLESKLNNATKIVQEPMFDSDISIPISDSDKELASETFNKFIEKIDKIHLGTFTESDAVWVSQHVVNDKNGFWIKDPLLLNSGISLSWRYSNSDPQHGFFRYLILTYNKLYKQWAADNNTEAKYPILDMNRSHAAGLDSYELGSIRGKSSEDLRVVVHLLSSGFKEEATQRLELLANEYGDKIQQAYAVVAPYQEGYSAGDSSVIMSLNLLKALEKSDRGSAASLYGILPKITWVEQNGVLKRKPVAVNTIGQEFRLGKVSDLQEIYQDQGELFNVLTTAHKFTPQEAKDLAITNVLNTSIKTYLQRSVVNLSDRNLFLLLTNTIDVDRDQFVAHSAAKFGVQPFELKEKTQKLEKISKLVNSLVSEIIVPGYPQKAIEKSNLKSIIGKLWANADYEDLVIATDLENIDLSNAETKDRVKSLLESRLILSYLHSKKQDPAWRSYIASLLYISSASETNQLLEVRFLNSLECLVVNHNQVLQETLEKFKLGQLDLRNNKGSISIIDPYTGEFKMKVGFTTFKKKKLSNYLTTHLSYNLLKSYNRV